MSAKGEYTCRTHCQVTVLSAPIVKTSAAAFVRGTKAVDGDRETGIVWGAVLHY